MMNRRSLLALPLAAAVSARAEKKLDFTRVSAITDEIGNSPEEAILFAQKYGMKWLELRGTPGGKSKSYHLLEEPALKAAAKQFADGGVRISFLNSPLLKHWLPGTEIKTAKPETPEARQRREENGKRLMDRRMEDLGKAIRAAQILGVDKLRVFTFSRAVDAEKQLPRIAEIIGEMSKVAEREKVKLLVENENSQNVVSCEETAALMKMIPSKWVGVNWDPDNGTKMKEPAFPDGYQRLPLKRLMNVQIKGKSLLDGYAEKLDWAAIFARLAKDGYTGQVGLETHIFGPQLIEHSHTCMAQLKRMLS
jgi:sugar phosphate isomerase/epimerase